MKSRTRNPAVGTAKKSVSQYDQEVLRYIRYQSPQNGSSELMICQLLLSESACLNRAKTVGRYPGSMTSCAVSFLYQNTRRRHRVIQHLGRCRRFYKSL